MSDSPKPVRIGGVRIGGIEVDRAIRARVRADLSEPTGPVRLSRVDSFGEGGPWQISDADLVAPVLLNAEMNSRTYYALEASRRRIG